MVIKRIRKPNSVDLKKMPSPYTVGEMQKKGKNWLNLYEWTMDVIGVI